MIEMDLEDYIEEVKFQMIDTYDEVLDREMILDWEEKARKWVEKDRGKSSCVHYRSEDDISIRIKREEVCETTAKKFYQAVIGHTVDGYWKNFKIV